MRARRASRVQTKPSTGGVRQTSNPSQPATNDILTVVVLGVVTITLTDVRTHVPSVSQRKGGPFRVSFGGRYRSLYYEMSDFI